MTYQQKLNRCKLALMEYDLEIRYIKGLANEAADCFPRIPPINEDWNETARIYKYSFNKLHLEERKLLSSLELGESGPAKASIHLEYYDNYIARIPKETQQVELMGAKKPSHEQESQCVSTNLKEDNPYEGGFIPINWQLPTEDELRKEQE